MLDRAGLLLIAVAASALTGLASAEQAGSELTEWASADPEVAQALDQSERGAETEPPVDALPSPEQMIAKSRGFSEELGSAVSVLRRRLEQAQSGRDVVKVLCLEDKLSQLGVIQTTTEGRLQGLAVAVQVGDGERTRHEFAVLEALGQRAASLSVEADHCIGEETGSVGEARKLKVTVDPDIANVEPLLTTDAILSVPPVLTSPTL